MLEIENLVFQRKKK